MPMQPRGTATFGKPVRGCTTSVRYPIASLLKHPTDLRLSEVVDSDKISLEENHH
jgi:hypothetical protein